MADVSIMTLTPSEVELVKKVNEAIEALNLKAEKTHNHDATYLKLTGGTLTGNLQLSNSAKFIIAGPSSNPTTNYLSIANTGYRSLISIGDTETLAFNKSAADSTTNVTVGRALFITKNNAVTAGTHAIALRVVDDNTAQLIGGPDTSNYNKYTFLNLNLETGAATFSGTASNANTAEALKTAVKISVTGAVSGNVTTDFSGAVNLATTLNNVDASKITGVLSIDNIPKEAMPTYVRVANDTERFALTKNDVQNNDIVMVEGITADDPVTMYWVIDDTKLNSPAGYQAFTAAIATAVPWTGILDKPATFPPSAHNQAASTITGLAAVATSGDYNDLINTPDSPVSSKGGTFTGEVTFNNSVNLQGNTNLTDNQYFTLPNITFNSSTDTTTFKAELLGIFNDKLTNIPLTTGNIKVYRSTITKGWLTGVTSDTASSNVILIFVVTGTNASVVDILGDPGTYRLEISNATTISDPVYVLTSSTGVPKKGNSTIDGAITTTGALITQAYIDGQFGLDPVEQGSGTFLNTFKTLIDNLDVECARVSVVSFGAKSASDPDDLNILANTKWTAYTSRSADSGNTRIGNVILVAHSNGKPIVYANVSITGSTVTVSLSELAAASMGDSYLRLDGKSSMTDAVDHKTTSGAGALVSVDGVNAVTVEKNSIHIGPATTTSGNVYIRPSGPSSSTNQSTFNSTGTLTLGNQTPSAPRDAVSKQYMEYTTLSVQNLNALNALGTDCNAYIQTGVYNLNSTTSTAITNGPVSGVYKAVLEVYTIGDPAAPVAADEKSQVMYATKDSGVDIYARRYTGSAWGSWIQFQRTDQAVDYANQLYVNTIPSNANLNDYTDPGFYVATTNKIAATLSNCPVTVAFGMNVSSTGAGIRQDLYTSDTSHPTMNFRIKTSTVWTTWKIMGEDIDMTGYVKTTSNLTFTGDNIFQGSTTFEGDLIVGTKDDPAQFIFNGEPFNNGIPIGYIFPVMDGIVPDDSLPLTGGLYSRDIYASLWDWVNKQSSRCVDEDTWQALKTQNEGKWVPVFSTGDGSTTFRLPLFNTHLSGTEDIDLVGSYATDTQRAGSSSGTFTSLVYTTDYTAPNTGTSALTGDFSRVANTAVRVGAAEGDEAVAFRETEVSLGSGASTLSTTEHIGTEVKPKTGYVLWCIKVCGGWTNVLGTDISELVTKLNNAVMKTGENEIYSDNTFYGKTTIHSGGENTLKIISDNNETGTMVRLGFVPDSKTYECGIWAPNNGNLVIRASENSIIALQSGDVIQWSVVSDEANTKTSAYLHSNLAATYTPSTGVVWESNSKGILAQDLNIKEGNTIGELKTAILNWVSSFKRYGISAAVFIAGNWVENWNNDATVLTPGGNWTITVAAIPNNPNNGIYYKLYISAAYTPSSYILIIENGVISSELSKIAINSDQFAKLATANTFTASNNFRGNISVSDGTSAASEGTINLGIKPANRAIQPSITAVSTGRMEYTCTEGTSHIFKLGDIPTFILAGNDAYLSLQAFGTPVLEYLTEAAQVTFPQESIFLASTAFSAPTTFANSVYQQYGDYTATVASPTVTLDAAYDQHMINTSGAISELTINIGNLYIPKDTSRSRSRVVTIGIFVNVSMAANITWNTANSSFSTINVAKPDGADPVIIMDAWNYINLVLTTSTAGVVNVHMFPATALMVV